MGSKNSYSPDVILSQNHQMLVAVHGGSYRHGFRGFAAKLTDEQALAMSKMPGVVSVFPNLKRSLHTTHSWDFMGLMSDESMEMPGYSTKNQQNVIIGFIDTGIESVYMWEGEDVCCGELLSCTKPPKTQLI